MNETEIKNLLRLIHSEDGQNALLAVSMLWGFEEIPKPLQLALGLVCYLEKDEGIVAEAEEVLKQKLGEESWEALTKGLLVFIKASSEYHILLKQPKYAVLNEEDYINAYYQTHESYRKIVTLHPYYLQLYLKAGIYWNYKSKITSAKTVVFFEDVLQFEPNHPYALFGLAEHTAQKLKYYDKAIGIYQQFLEKHPAFYLDNAMMQHYLIVEYTDLPTTFNALQHIARIYYEQHADYEKATRYYQKAKDWIPTHPALDWCRCVELFWMYREDISTAFEWVENGLQVFANNKFSKEHRFSLTPLDVKIKKAKLHELAGDLYQEELEKTGKALEHYRQALKEVHTLTTARLKQIRLVFHHFKDYWQVENLCKKALELSPKNHEAKRYLKMSRKARGIGVGNFTLSQVQINTT